MTKDFSVSFYLPETLSFFLSGEGQVLNLFGGEKVPSAFPVTTTWSPRFSTFSQTQHGTHAIPLSPGKFLNYVIGHLWLQFSSVT